MCLLLQMLGKAENDLEPVSSLMLPCSLPVLCSTQSPLSSHPSSKRVLFMCMYISGGQASYLLKPEQVLIEPLSLHHAKCLSDIDIDMCI